MDFCKAHDMKVWILDDKHFPSGYSNGYIKEHPEYAESNITEKHIDIAGPVADGSLILDSVANNATAHYLHNMFFLLGDTMEQSARVSELTAECFRANDIESFDTCSIRMKAGETPLYFVASHATAKKRNPEFVYTFENATVTYSQDEGSRITATFRDGSVKQYGDPFEDSFIKIWDCVDAIRSHQRPICTVETAMPHTELIGRLHREIPIRTFDSSRVHLNPDTDAVVVDGLFEAMYEAYEKEALLSEFL
jgi:hypothetical protein